MKGISPLQTLACRQRLQGVQRTALSLFRRRRMGEKDQKDNNEPRQTIIQRNSK